MYESHYGFLEKPFNLTPDPKYLYLSRRHADAFAHLEFGHRERGGFVVITGEVGTGKTTLARYFLGRLGERTATAGVLYPALTAAELLRSIVEDLHVSPGGSSLKELVDALHHFLLEARREERDVVLLIDEAQDLSPEVLEQVRLISNLETDTEKLLTIVLIGQSELQEKLARSELRQLAQRVTARYHLSPLAREETEDYVRHRIDVAGGAGKVAFTSQALRAVHRRSGGIPRLINLICDRALLAGYVEGVREITRAMVQRAAREVRGEYGARLTPRRVVAAAGGVAVTAAVVAALWLHGEPPGPALPAVEAGPALDVGIRTDKTSPALGATLISLSREDSFTDARSALEALWGDGSLPVTSLRTHMPQVRRLDLPVILEMFHPARDDTCFLALLRLEGDDAVLAVGGARLRVPVSQVDRLWTRQAFFPWRRADVGQAETWVGDALTRQGYVEAASDLGAAVSRFQQDAELVPDGIIGSRTLMALYSLESLPRPRLSGARPPRPGEGSGGVS